MSGEMCNEICNETSGEMSKEMSTGISVVSAGSLLSMIRVLSYVAGEDAFDTGSGPSK